MYTLWRLSSSLSISTCCVTEWTAAKSSVPTHTWSGLSMYSLAILRMPSGHVALNTNNTNQMKIQNDYKKKRKKKNLVMMI